MGDLLELVDYVSFAAVLAAVPPLVPDQHRRVRRLARAPLICVALWLAALLPVVTAHDAFTGELGWLLPAWLASIFFATLGVLFYIAWLVGLLFLSPQARRALVPYAVYAACVAAVAGVTLVADLWQGLVAVAMLVCALFGAALHLLLRHHLHNRPKHHRPRRSRWQRSVT